MLIEPLHFAEALFHYRVFFQVVVHSQVHLCLMCTILIMGKSWMMIKDRLKSKEYVQGDHSFLEFAAKNLGPQDEIRCPCVDCLNGTKFSPHVVRLHLI